jgi:hypothetical protein
MKTITKKCQPPYFEQILNGTKRFEIRLNHLDIKDILTLFYNEKLNPSDLEVQCFSIRREGKTTEFITKAKEHNIDLEHYEVGDTLRLREWDGKTRVGNFEQIAPHTFRDNLFTDGYTGREVACRITSIVKISINPLNQTNGDKMWIAYPHIIFDDHSEWWTPTEIGRYGLVVLGLEVLK